MNHIKRLREVRGVLEEMNVPLVSVEHGKHIKFRIRTPHGDRLLVCAGTSSDYNLLRMVRRQVRHLMAGQR